ncbi:MAG: transcriptional regulator [Chitinophagaceae bacterium]|nr:MAG: transcriptional regulator [Chitinophagaceae bacterium]
MDAEESFVASAALLCEPTRARLLWCLLDSRSYTAGELALTAGISSSSASNHLLKLQHAGIVKVDSQGRHRYYSFSRPEVAYVIEALASLGDGKVQRKMPGAAERDGVKYCRSCYDHIAGYVGVSLVEALEHAEFLRKSANGYLVTTKGWGWFATLGISKEMFEGSPRPLTRQCLDWSERRPHLAGQLGAALYKSMLKNGWLRKVKFSRELVVTAKGAQQLQTVPGMRLK